MARVMIHPKYADMKKGFPSEQHDFWEKNQLDWINLEYAAIDAYVAFELYRQYLEH